MARRCLGAGESVTRPVILVDQDGPLADFDKQFWHLCRMANIQMDCEEHEQTARFATEHIVRGSDRAYARRRVDGDRRWFHDLPVVPGAVEGINLLSEVADVWICTKPLEANLTCRDGKAEWVRTHLGLEWERRLIIAPDKSRVHGDILLDDAIRMEWLGRATWQPVVYPTTWNDEGSEWHGLRRWDWSRPVEELLEMCPSL